MNARPAGRWDPVLQVTICTDTDYQCRVISNIAHEMRTEKAGMLEEREVGDCVIFPTGYEEYRQRVGVKVKMANMWARFDTMEAAFEFVREVRAAKEAA
jgi:hypothetical protein